MNITKLKASLDQLEKLLEKAVKGGAGSGNFDHTGRPGRVGGSGGGGRGKPAKPSGGSKPAKPSSGGSSSSSPKDKPKKPEKPATSSSSQSQPKPQAEPVAKPSSSTSSKFPDSKQLRKLDKAEEKKHAGQLNKLNDKQKQVLTEYTAGAIDYRSINQKLRDGKELKGKEKKEYDQLQDAIKAAGKLPEGTTVYRGIQVDAATQKKMVDSFKEAAKSGGSVSMPGLTSTSIDPGVASGFSRGGIVFEMKPKTGAYLSEISSFDKMASKVKGAQKENEILLADGKKYRVVGVQEDVSIGKKARKGQGNTVVQLEEID